MFRATIVDKTFQNGMLRVHVVFTDDAGATFADVFETNQIQPPTWIDEQVKRRLVHLNALPELHEAIPVGKEIRVEPAAPGEPVSLLTPREQYQADLARFEKFVAALSKGFTTQENQDFVVLKKRLTDNFKSEYLDLF